MSAPLCFDSERQWAGWQEAAQKTGITDSYFCEDCTPEHKAAMVGQRRCAYPGVKFYIDADGFMAGRRRRGVDPALPVPD